MFADRTTYAPLTLLEYDHQPGSYYLRLTDGEMLRVQEVFEANGREANGYGWTDLALQVIRSGSLDLESRVSFDPEAGSFVAYGSDLEALKQLGALLSALFDDRQRLGELVAAAPYEYD